MDTPDTSKKDEPKGAKYTQIRCNVCNLGYKIYSNGDGSWKVKQPCIHIVFEGVYNYVV